MLSEACKTELMDHINDVSATIGGVSISSKSMRNREFVNESGLYKQPYNKTEGSKEDPRISVKFANSTVSRRFLYDVLDVDSDGVITYGYAKRCECEIKVSARQYRSGQTLIHAKRITEAIMDQVMSKIRKGFDKILREYNAAIDNSKEFIENDLSNFVQADIQDERSVRFWIRYEESWNVVDDVSDAAPPTKVILLTVEDVDQSGGIQAVIKE